MRDRLQNAFAVVLAEDRLKTKTLAALACRPRQRRGRALAWAAVCLLLVLGLGGGIFFTPASAISIDINPSLELTVNRFDRVIRVEGYNEDGRELAQSTGLLFADYTQALRALLADTRVQDCLGRGEALSIFVACDDEQRSSTMLANVEACAGSGGNVHCMAGNWAESAAAHEAGLSCGKYRAFLELQALDPATTPEDVQGLTMREIRQKIAEISGEDATITGHGCGGNQHGKGRHRKHTSQVGP